MLKSQLRRMWNETVVVNGPRTSESVAVNHSQDLSVVPSRGNYTFTGGFQFREKCESFTFVNATLT